MSKFKFKLKIQGLELEMEGARDDIPSMASSLGNHIAGLIQPASDMAAGEVKESQPGSTPFTIEHSPLDSPSSKKKRRRASSSAKPGDTSEEPLEWQHDPNKYGNPQQSWNPTKKSLWLLYVAAQELQITQLSVSRICNTFNRKFKQFGAVRGSNISRDLGKAKVRNPSLTQEDTSKTPVEWYLTDAGIKEVQLYIAQSKGESASDGAD